jgi:hypothetical protein
MLAYHSALDVSTCLIMSFDPYIGKCGVHFCLSMIHSQVQISCTCIYTLFGLFPSGVEYPGRKMTVTFLSSLLEFSFQIEVSIHIMRSCLLCCCGFTMHASFFLVFIFLFGSFLSLSSSFVFPFPFSPCAYLFTLLILWFIHGKWSCIRIPVLWSFLLLYLALILSRACRLLHAMNFHLEQLVYAINTS